MTLDPRVFSAEAIEPATRDANALLEALLAQTPPLHMQTPGAIRAAREAGRGWAGPIVRLPHAQTRSIRGPGGEIPLRVIRPGVGEVRGVYVHIHGGGHGRRRRQHRLSPGTRAPLPRGP